MIVIVFTPINTVRVYLFQAESLGRHLLEDAWLVLEGGDYFYFHMYTRYFYHFKVPVSVRVCVKK